RPVSSKPLICRAFAVPDNLSRCSDMGDTSNINDLGFRLSAVIQTDGICPDGQQAECFCVAFLLGLALCFVGMQHGANLVELLAGKDTLRAHHMNVISQYRRPNSLRSACARSSAAFSSAMRASGASDGQAGVYAAAFSGSSFASQTNVLLMNSDG